MKNTSSILLSLSLVFASPAFGRDVDALILDGRPVPGSSLVSKAMVLVSVGGSTCSGVAISRNHVLTAGHCAGPSNAPSSIRLFVGAGKAPGPAVSRVDRHPRYGWEGDFVRADLTVLRLAAPFGAEVTPARLPDGEIRNGENLIAAGYGYSDRARTRIRNLLQGTFVFGRDAGYAESSFSDGSRLLLFDGPINLCSGDSGGATFTSASGGLRVVGIHSMANCRSVGLDIVVRDHLSWIRSRMAAAP